MRIPLINMAGMRLEFDSWFDGRSFYFFFQDIISVFHLTNLSRSSTGNKTNCQKSKVEKKLQIFSRRKKLKFTNDFLLYSPCDCWSNLTAVELMKM